MRIELESFQLGLETECLEICFHSPALPPVFLRPCLSAQQRYGDTSQISCLSSSPDQSLVSTNGVLSAQGVSLSSAALPSDYSKPLTLIPQGRVAPVSSLLPLLVIGHPLTQFKVQRTCRGFFLSSPALPSAFTGQVSVSVSIPTLFYSRQVLAALSSTCPHAWRFL